LGKIIPSALISSIKGKINDSTFQSWKGRITLRNTGSHSQRFSENSYLTKGYASFLSSCYYLLTSDQVYFWNYLGTLFPSLMSGFDAFMKVNLALSMAQNNDLQPYSTAPVSYSPPDTPVYFSCRYSQRNDELQLYWAIPSESNIYVTGCFAVQVGLSTKSSPSWKNVSTVKSIFNCLSIDVSDYPDNFVFYCRARSISTLGFTSQWSLIDSATKNSVFTYPPWIITVDESLNRIQKFHEYDWSFVNLFGSIGSGPGEFSSPSDICSDEDFLYICDSGNNRICKYSKNDYSFISAIGTSGSDDDQFNSPQGICCDDIYLYICDTNNSRIVKRLKSDLSFVSKIGTYGSGNDNFDNPLGICVDSTYIYICDTCNNRIVKRLKSNLSYVSHFGTSGSGDDQFDYPYGIDCNDTYLYICDYNNHRLKVHLKSTLAYFNKVGSQGSGINEFKYPAYVAINETEIYVSDTGNYRVMVRGINSLGYVAWFGEHDSDPGNFEDLRGICTMSKFS